MKFYSKKLFNKFWYYFQVYIDPVAQLVEQWPFKPLVVRSSRTRITEEKPDISLIKPSANVGGFLFHIYSYLFIHS